MDFFAQQDDARRKTGLLLFYFALAILVTSLLVYIIPVAGLHYVQTEYANPTVSIPFRWWIPELFVGAFGVTLLLIVTGALYKASQLKLSGGSGVASMLGGREIHPDTNDFFEKRLRNVVEEMAIASGVPVPRVYLLEHEMAINAFAAGFSTADAVVAVTYGTMTGLTRDELQGVIAHEFSHILNNDVKLNISLMGFLHGLLLITLIGRIVMRLGFGSSRSSRDKGGGLPFIAGGLGLILVGSVGLLFAKLIKAAVSRSRERLADASAVQFTRNPTGLSNALKKIGGLSYGSKIRSPNAEQASHMFFGNGLGSSIFNTHPPLTERVRWLDPHFTGDFSTVSLEDLQQNLARFEGAPTVKVDKKPDIVDLFTDPVKLATATGIVDQAGKPAAPTFGINEPEKLLETIGAPMEHHAQKARELIASIPKEYKELARDPFGARALIYLLLLDSDEEIRETQLTILREKAEPGVYEAMKKVSRQNLEPRPEQRLPMVDLAIPALRFLSPSQYAAFRLNVKLLTDADNQVSIFEFALQRVLMRSLYPVFNKRQKKPINYYAIRGIEKETSVILSVLARIGQDEPEEIEAAFREAAGSIVAPNATFALCPEEECNWKTFNAALDKVEESSFKVRKWILAAALVCLMHDREITIEEVELFRSVADSLDCPVPPWVAPGECGK